MVVRGDPENLHVNTGWSATGRGRAGLASSRATPAARRAWRTRRTAGAAATTRRARPRHAGRRCRGRRKEASLPTAASRAQVVPGGGQRRARETGRRGAARRSRGPGKAGAGAGPASPRTRAGYRVRHRLQLRRRRAACARAARNRPRSTGEPAAASGPRVPDVSEASGRHISISSKAVTQSGPSLREARRSESLTARVIAEIAIASIGGALLACAVAANQRWLDRHFLPSFFLPRQWYVAIETLVRLAMAALGVALALFARPRIGRFAARAPARTLQIAIAAGLAL